MRQLVCIALLSLATSCGPKQTAPTPPPGDDTEPTGGADAAVAEAPPAARVWKDLTVAEKKDIMKKEVVPRMRELWKTSPEPDEDIDCTTCHGDQAMDGKFDMPNKDLPPLDFTNGLADYKKEKDGPAWLEFMGKQVKPEMAKILGMPEYSPEHPDGFGCAHCHGTVKF